MRKFRKTALLFALVAAIALGCAAQCALAEDADRIVPEIETREKVGYYERYIEATLDPDDLCHIEESDSAYGALDTDIPQDMTIVTESLEINAMLEDELANGGYTWDDPLVISNPYRYAPLTGVIVFETEDSASVRVTVKGKTESADLTGVVPAATAHRVPVIGLYPGEETTVVLELLDDAGDAVKTQTLSMFADPLPESLKDRIEPVQTSGSSAYGLTVVYGLKCNVPFAYDCNGDIRWYLDHKTGNFGLYMLSGGHMILQDKTMGMTPNHENPQVTNLYEFDCLGRFYRLYYVANGSHHEVIEKEPGGNLLCATSSMESHYDEEVVELDRQTGARVNELELTEVFGDTYTDLIDWAHINTVSWQADDDTVILSCRNIHAGIKIGWTDHKIRWILSDPAIWEGTPFEQYVLKPTNEFHWQFQQHTVYQIDTDLDNDPDTVEITMFDNHIHSSRKVASFDRLKKSYAKVFAVNEQAGTVTLLKEFEVVRSNITSNTTYDPASGHLFAMCGWVPKVRDYHTGMTYEFDYQTGELLNQFLINKTFYRASNMIFNYDDLSQPMSVEEKYIKGVLKQPVEVAEQCETPEEVLVRDTISTRFVGSVLYVTSLDHRISQVIFKGDAHVYVYDVASIPQYYTGFKKVSVPMPIPTQNLAPDRYQVLCVYKDKPYSMGKYFEIK